MADLTPQVIVLTGLEPSYQACAAGGDAVVNDGRIFLHFVNGATESEVTVDSVRACDQGVDHNVVVTVPASEDKMIGPFNKDRFNDANGKIQITYTNVTTITVAAIRLPL
ncbi:MAG: hypothetical protein HWN66_22195 [Candidatus Helarchaeota archaeon]|nr:hypothetical protein [Candidatus Helarchaeota archaeon]